MPKPADSAAPRDLPLDVWRKIAQHVPFPHRAKIAGTSRAVAQAVRDSWTEAHYFQCVGQPNKPAELRVPHRLPERDEQRPWLAMAREAQVAPKAAGDPRGLLQHKPQRALLALARQTSPAQAWEASKLWPVYEEALNKAFRGTEAKHFTQRIKDVAALQAALQARDSDGAKRLIEAGVPVPDGAIAWALHDQPLVDAVVASLQRDGRSELLSSFFLMADRAGRFAIAAAPAFQQSAALRRQVMGHLEGPFTSSPMADFAQACSPQQCRELLGVVGRPGVGAIQRTHGLGDVRLAVWLRAGGDPAEALCDARYLRDLEITQLVEALGGGYGAVLQAFMRKNLNCRPDSGSVRAIADALLSLGARVSAETFTSFVRRHSTSSGHATSDSAEALGRRFAAHGAVPVDAAVAAGSTKAIRLNKLNPFSRKNPLNLATRPPFVERPVRPREREWCPDVD